MRTDRPGYQCRPRKDGTTVHYWNPQRAVKGASRALSSVRLPDDSTDDQISKECQRLTAALTAEVRKAGTEPAFDGTVRSLIECYRHDKTSTWHSVKHSTRIRDHEPSLRVLVKNVGDRDINALRGSDFSRWFN